MQPCPCCSHKHAGVTDAVRRRRHLLPEVLEIFVGSCCSVMTWVYTVQNELPRKNTEVPEQLNIKNPIESFNFRPSPGLMLFSCLVFGCCVSSFTHRRQSQDPFQILVFLILLGGAALIGYRDRASVHLVLLGYLPWATCAAMAFSISGHSLYRALKPSVATPQLDEEKARLLG